MRLSFLLAGLPLLAQQTVDQSTVRKERTLGASLAVETRLASGRLGIDAVSEYVDWIGERLSKAIDGPRFDYRFEVIVTTDDGESDFLASSCPRSSSSPRMPNRSSPDCSLMWSPTSSSGTDSWRREPRNRAGSRAGSHLGAQRRSPILPDGVREMHLRNEMVSDEFAVPLLVRAGFDPSGSRRYVARVQPEETRQRRL